MLPSLFLPPAPILPTFLHNTSPSTTCYPHRPRATLTPPKPSSTHPSLNPPLQAPARSAPPPSHEPLLHDVAVIGAGPAGLSLAAALCRRNAAVIVLDPALEKPWPNHYGVWKDEFEQVGLQHCATAIYDKTSVYAGGEKIVLDRPYLRVDRVKLKKELVKRCIDGGAELREVMVQKVEHVTDEESRLWLTGSDDGAMVRARVVVDCTGHGTKFTEREERGRYVQPWEQAAYGIEAEVESYPYDEKEMLLMDYRDDHMQGSEELKSMSEMRPTFLYVFPSGPGRAFFEETSVIAPTAVPFEELKERLYERLRHDGVKVKKVIEEEFSLIPMGGSLPRRQQRVIGFGGTAGLVHPATGYMVARTVRLADDIAASIVNGLECGLTPTEVGHQVWERTWSLEMRRQRDFLQFGAELLGKLNMDESCRFFEAFFALPQSLWAKFLAYRLDEPADRMYFALYFFVIASWPIRWGLLKGIAEIGQWNLIRSVLPLWMSAKDKLD